MNTIFVTDRGVEVPSVSESQMQEIDRIAIEVTGPDLLQMMENAGRNLAIQAIELLGDDWKAARIMVLAGKGGNGGGGICAARHLANRGANVGVLLANPGELSEAAAWQRHIYAATSGGIVANGTMSSEKPDLIIDALIGYSLAGPPRSDIEELIDWANSHGSPALSLDIPSGIDSTTGEAPGAFIKAVCTLTLALPKTGLGNQAAGEIMLADIGIPARTFEIAGIQYESPFESGFTTPLRRSARDR